jgi:hypothetical protein
LGEKWRRNETNIAEMFRKERKFLGKWNLGKGHLEVQTQSFRGNGF